jgi:hypothetical protein
MITLSRRRAWLLLALSVVLVLVGAGVGYVVGHTSPSTVSCWLINGQKLYPDPADFATTTSIQPETCTVRVENTMPWALVATDRAGHSFTLYAG